MKRKYWKLNFSLTIKGLCRYRVVKVKREKNTPEELSKMRGCHQKRDLDFQESQTATLPVFSGLMQETAEGQEYNRKDFL